MKKISAVIVAILMVLPAVSVFAQDQPAGPKKEVTSSDVKKKTGEAVNTTGAYVKEKKERYQKKAEEKLKRFENRLKRMQVRAEKAEEKAKEKLSRATEEMKQKSEEAKSKLHDLKTAAGEKWEQGRKELDEMLKDLEHSYNRAVSRSGEKKDDQ